MVKKAVAIGRRIKKCSGNAIEKDMENVNIAFQIISVDEKLPNQFQHVDCHMVFDI